MTTADAAEVSPSEATRQAAIAGTFSGVGVSITLEQNEGATQQPSSSNPHTAPAKSVEFVFQNAQGALVAFAHSFLPTNLPSQNAKALLFPLPPGRWTLQESTLLLGRTRVSFPLLPQPSTPLSFETKQGSLLHLGELKMTLSSGPGSGTSTHTDVKTLFLPSSPPRAKAWEPFQEVVQSVQLEIWVPIQGTREPVPQENTLGTLPFEQIVSPLLFEEGDKSPQSPLDPQGRYVGLLSNAPGYAFFEMLPNTPNSDLTEQVEKTTPLRKVIRVRSTLLNETEDLYAFYLNAPDGSRVVYRGGCFPSAPASFLPQCPLANVVTDAEKGRKETKEPLAPGSFRYLGFLEVDLLSKVFFLREDLPASARNEFQNWLQPLLLRSFVLGENLRNNPQGVWNFVDAGGSPIQGFPPGARQFTDFLQKSLQACTQDLWRADPLAPSNFLIWIETFQKSNISIVENRSTGFVGPGLRHLQACLEQQVATADALKAPTAFRGIGAQFHEASTP